MTSAARGNRFSPGSVLAMAVVSGLLLGLVALCGCAGAHPAAPPLDHTSAMLSAPGADAPAGTGAGRPADGCDRPAEHPDAIVASATVITRDVVVAVARAHVRAEGAAVRTPAAGGGGPPARVHAARLLCVMRT